MKKIRFVTILSIALILILVTVFQASAFTYLVETLNNTITKEQTARFSLLIRNTADYDDFFTISTRDVNWLVDVEPSSGVVKAGEDVEFIVELRPKPLIIEGRTHFIPVKIKSETTGFHFEEKQDFAIYVRPEFIEPGVYPVHVTPIVYMDKEVNPNEKISVRLNLKNQNLRDLEDLKVVINGEIFYKEYTTHLMPLEEKTNEILFEVDSLVTPGKRTTTITLFFEDKQTAQSTVEYDVVGYTDIRETPSIDTLLFRTKEKYTFVNNGNDKGVAEKKFRMNFFKRLFTKFSPEPAKEKGSDGKTYYVIRQELDSEEVLEIVIVTNYRLLVIIILVIIIAIVLYYALRSPIIVVKSAEPLGKTKEGVSEIKVRLYLKNRSRRPLNNLRVVDNIPSIAEIEKKARLGSMEPVNIGKSKRGTVARWELDVLEPYEERIITYKIKSKLKLIGGIKLPSAKARFDAKQGKERVTYSKGINLVSKE